MKKFYKILSLAVMLIAAFSVTAFAANFSPNWYEDGAGWHIKDSKGATVKDAWLCDDVQDPSKNTWYLIDGNGNMVSDPLVQDGTGNYYSLETEHNGYYGMLRYKNGTYGGVALTFNQKHDGSFAAITGGLNELKAKYAVKSVAHINNSNCVYTSSFGTGAQAAAQTSASAGASSNTDRLYWLNEYCCVGCNTDEERIAKGVENVRKYGNGYSSPYMTTQSPKTYAELQKFLTSIDWPNMSEKDRLEACFNRIATGHNGNVYGGGSYGEIGAYEWKVLTNRKGICQDYATELAQLCHFVGLKAEVFGCRVNDTTLGGHDVTKVMVDGTWYAVDPTWSNGGSLDEQMYVFGSDEFNRIYMSH